MISCGDYDQEPDLFFDRLSVVFEIFLIYHILVIVYADIHVGEENIQGRNRNEKADSKCAYGAVNAVEFDADQGIW